MIGDWVKLIYKAGSFVSKVNLDNLKDYQDDRMKFEPIPLTKEILELNGFVVDYKDMDGCYVMFDTKDNVLPLLQTKDGSGWSTCDQYIYIYYVHQFQHFLRLIEDERADNFKVI